MPEWIILRPVFENKEICLSYFHETDAINFSHHLDIHCFYTDLLLVISRYNMMVFPLEEATSVPDLANKLYSGLSLRKCNVNINKSQGGGM